MPKKATPLEKTARMLDLVPFITTHQGIPTSELASEFGISVNELLSDLNSLWMCGDTRFDLIDLEFESGFVTIRNAQTLNLTRSLSQQETISVLIGLDLIGKNLPEERTDLSSELSQLRSKLGDGLARTVDATPALDGDIVAILESALLGKSKIQISYFSPIEDEITERTIVPIQIAISAGKHYLTAFCERAQAERSFRIDRIRSAINLEVRSSSQLSSKNETILIPATVKIVRQLRKCRESLGNFVTGEGALVNVSSYNPEWLSRTVISAAGAMEVTSSPELRGRVGEFAATALQEYR